MRTKRGASVPLLPVPVPVADPALDARPDWAELAAGDAVNTRAKTGPLLVLSTGMDITRPGGGRNVASPREANTRAEAADPGEPTRREMTFDEAQAFVLALLSDGQKHTTQDIDAASARAGKRCPDATVRFLARMRLMGQIEGALSLPHRTWLWWDPANGPAPEPPAA